MDTLLNLRTFVAVTRWGNFSNTARHMHVVPSVVVKRISQLERALGGRLFERTTRRIALTPAGLELQNKAVDLLAGFDDVVKGVRRSRGELQGHIKVMAPATLTLLYLGDVLNSFIRTHRRVTLEVMLIDRSISPLEEGFDLAISGRSGTFDGVVDIPLCPADVVLVASADYLARAGVPGHPRELMDRECLVFKPSGSSWQFQSARDLVTVDVPARLTADDNLTLRNAALAGQGLAIIPRYVVWKDLASRALQVVLPQFPPQQNWFKVYVPRRRIDIPLIKAMVDWLTQHMREIVPKDAAPRIKKRPKTR